MLVKASITFAALVLCTAIVASATVASTVEWEKKCDIPANFTTQVPPLVGFDYKKKYLLLAVQKDKPEDNGGAGNWTPPASTHNYTLHGIWPNFYGTKPQNSTTYPMDKNGTSELHTGCWPQFCYYTPPTFNVRKAIPQPLQTEMATFWHSIKTPGWDPKKGDDDPNASMWLHEWAKHGTCCNGVTEADYFGHAVEILRRLEWLPKCESMGHKVCYIQIVYAAHQ